MKTILITGATDGIGLETARILAAQGHRLLLHGRNKAKLTKVRAELSTLGSGEIERYVADLSDLKAVRLLAAEIKDKHSSLDVLINNAGVFKTADTRTASGLDVRFVVNSLAPYLLTRELQSLLSQSSRVINLSSAAQSPVNLAALRGDVELADMSAYAQSKLAITMWSFHLAKEWRDGPSVLAVNPGSLLASKMVKEGFGVAGNDLRIGADILCRLSLDEEFSEVTGQYFDNDSGHFSSPHPDALDDQKCAALVKEIEFILKA